MAEEKRTVRVVDTERFPFFRVTRTNAGHTVEVEPATLARWERVMGEFEDVQNEMEKLHDDALRAEAERARIAKAEADVVAAQMRLERARREQTHRPDNPASWEFIGDGAVPCGGIQYVDEKDARAERMRLHNEWPGITFDIKPYWCVHGHCHLGRSS